jgi:hypothetical protein
VDHDNDIDVERSTHEQQESQCLRNSCQGIGGNNNNHNRHNNNDNHDPFSMVKISIPSFHGSYDVEAYLDWEMTIEQIM